MRNWHAFLDSLDSDGGHILVLVVLMTMGAAMHALGSSDSVLAGAFGALLLALKNTGSNRERNKE